MRALLRDLRFAPAWAVRGDGQLGLRRAVGAPARPVVDLVVRQGTTRVPAGLALSRVPIALPAGPIGATDPSTYAGVPRVLVVVGLRPTYIPARRATRIDPRVALRHE
ncbi:hypothetical protein [Nannocystis pusilla]|uniref:hypothetical protein n=1 Tax=Nannocystis pusilla TaxID=889268 RepID=UPI003B7AE2AC